MHGQFTSNIIGFGYFNIEFGSYRQKKKRHYTEILFNIFLLNYFSFNKQYLTFYTVN